MEHCKMRKFVMGVTLPWLWVFGTSQGAEWYRGSTHIHTANSVGDSTPEEVVKWYREHGYNFVFVTDHQMITDVAPLNAKFGVPGQFLVMPGEEVSANFSGPAGKIYVHVNALNPRQPIVPVNGGSARDTLQQNLDAIHAAAGLAQINHPNFMWQLNAADIAAVKGARLLEIMNMQPVVNSFGAGADAPSVEEMWDRVLSRGVILWGVASDDASEFKTREPNSLEGQPGRGWIVVRAEHLTSRKIMQAIDKGDFYASTGIRLKDYKVEGRQITIEMPDADRYLTKYRTRFLGKDGVVLHETTAASAVYAIKGNEGYVRADISDSNGKMAWTQPVVISTH
jgi:hypothetical protein